jgi:phosphate transport system substrate-binding protein
MMRIRVAMVAALFVLIGCQTSQEDERAHLLITGSSTVYPFSKAVADRFHAANANVPRIIVQSTGTSDGIAQFCGGMGGTFPDIVNASRRVRASELRTCAANGVDQVSELQIGIDGIVLAQSPAGHEMALSARHIYMALAATPFGQPQTRRNWREVDPSLPDKLIEVHGPPADGTRESFIELIMLPGCETDPAMRALRDQDAARFRQVCGAIRTDGVYVEAGEDDERTAVTLVVSPRTIGIFGWNYLERQGERLRAIPIQGVAPNAASIASGEYVAARPLYLYVKAGRADTVQGLREYLAEYARAIAPGGYLAQLGLIPAPDAIRSRTVQTAGSLAPISSSALR